MKAVILAGGYGTRLSEETAIKPKPMVEIGEQPILWHIMKAYSAHGINEFVICLGYKGHLIKEFFANYYMRMSAVTFDMRLNETTLHECAAEPWRVTLVDTGDQTMTGGRLKRIRNFIGNEPFCMTYGDGVSDIDLTALVDFHNQQGALATLTTVQPPGRFGALSLGADQRLVSSFNEKPDGDSAWINGGFFVLESGVFDFIDGDDSVWEREPLERLAAAGQLAAYRHRGYWQNMDTLRDRHVLEELWAAGQAPWKIWRDG